MESSRAAAFPDEREEGLDHGGFHHLKEEMKRRGPSDGLKMADLLELPEPLSAMLSWIMRQGQVTIAELAAYLGADETGVQEIVAGLRDTGWVRETESCGLEQYCVRLAPRRGNPRSSDLWKI